MRQSGTHQLPCTPRTVRYWSAIRPTIRPAVFWAALYSDNLFYRSSWRRYYSARYLTHPSPVAPGGNRPGLSALRDRFASRAPLLVSLWLRVITHSFYLSSYLLSLTANTTPSDVAQEEGLIPERTSSCLAQPGITSSLQHLTRRLNLSIYLPGLRTAAAHERTFAQKDPPSSPPCSLPLPLPKGAQLSAPR